MRRRARIRSVKARVCFNSRGEEAVEVDVLVDGALGRACSPAGASVGRYEAVAFPAGGAKTAVSLVSRYSRKLGGLDAADPKEVATALREIDGTGDFSRIGGSAAYAITLASVEAASKHLGVPLFKLLRKRAGPRLPLPLGNVIGGGKHAGKGAPDIQEFLVCPVGSRNIVEAARGNIEVHREVRKRLERKDPYFTGGRGDEGAWAPHLSDEEVFEIVKGSARSVSDRVGFEIRIGVDVAASSLWDEGSKRYVYSNPGRSLDHEEQYERILSLIDTYQLLYVEDPFHEEAFGEFSRLRTKVKGTLVVGDDLFVTNKDRLVKGARIGAANGAILKVNQAGTLADALDFAAEANRRGISVVASHRSGESVDAHLPHIAIAADALMMKSGVVGGERVAKMNELIRISKIFDVRSMSKLPFF